MKQDKYIVHHLEQLFKITSWWYLFAMNGWLTGKGKEAAGYQHIRRVIHQELEQRR